MKETEKSTEIGIARIRDDSALLRDGSLIAVLEVEPIAYDKLGERSKHKVEKAYKEWLDSLDYPVQIVARRMNLDIKDQAKVIKNRVEYLIKQKEEYRDLLKLFKEFEEWLDAHLKKRVSQRTVYYLVIPVFSAGKIMKGMSLKKIKTNGEYKRALETLNNRVKHAIEMLSPTGVSIRKLDDELLENLYDSYFNTVFFSDGSYHNPQRWIEKWRSSKDAQE